MRLPASCLQCNFEEWEATGAAITDATCLLELTEDGIYVGECEKGHAIHLSLQSIRYELLFECGAVAFLAGFNREAIATTATALERFFEFAIEVLATAAGLQREQFKDCWNAIEKQSERQLGAFLMLYGISFGRPFTTPNGRRPFQKLIEVRNAVVHKGRIPSRKEAFAFTEDVYELIGAVRRDLFVRHAEIVSKLSTEHHFDNQREAHKRHPPTPTSDGKFRSSISVLAAPLILDGAYKSPSRRFEDSLKLATHRLQRSAAILPGARL